MTRRIQQQMQPAQSCALHRPLLCVCVCVCGDRFINVSSAHVSVPFATFAAATAVGLLPANYLHVSTGMQLQAIGATDSDESSTWTSTLGRVAGLFLLAFVALIPTLWTKSVEGGAAQQQTSRTAAKRE